MRIIVVGAGTIGLTAGIALLEAGFRNVTIVSEQFTPQTTTDQSGALWRPVFVECDDKTAIDRWGDVTFRRYFAELQQHGTPSTGLSLVPGYELYLNRPNELPSWRHIVQDFRVLDEKEVQPFVSRVPFKAAFAYTSIIAEPLIYMPFLMKRFMALGGVIRQARVARLADLSSEADVIVNCCGLGARHLADDKAIYPCRGQVVKVHDPSIRHFFIVPEDDYLAYIFPRSTDVLLGGTHQDHDAELQVRDVDTQGILDRCASILPQVRNAPIRTIGVGLRPSRPSVRFELDTSKRFAAVPIIHNYGHGGSGMTLNWGCAEDVVKLIQKIEKSKIKSKL